MHVERTFTVAAAPDRVFDRLADFTSTEAWDPGTLETRRLAGDGGLGTTYSNVSRFMGRRVELIYETVTHEPPDEVRFRGVNGRTTATDWLRFSPVDDGAATRIHYRAAPTSTSRRFWASWPPSSSGAGSSGWPTRPSSSCGGHWKPPRSLMTAVRFPPRRGCRPDGRSANRWCCRSL